MMQARRRNDDGDNDEKGLDSLRKILPENFAKQREVSKLIKVLWYEPGHKM